MKHNLKKALYFLRLTDEDNILSITNIGCIVVLTKVAMNPAPSVVDMGTLLVTLSLYFGKAHLNRNKVKVTADAAQRLSDVEDKIKGIQGVASSLSAQMGLGNILKK